MGPTSQVGQGHDYLNMKVDSNCALTFQESVEVMFPRIFWAFAGFVAQGVLSRWSQAPGIS
jgi:hypothetical protein